MARGRADCKRVKRVRDPAGAFQFLVGSARCADLDAAARRPYLGIV